MSEPSVVEQFHALQSRLRARFLAFRSDSRQPYTAVVVPSQSFDPHELAKIDGVAHYEERSLFNLMLLRYPRLKVVYVTSKRLNPVIVDYYLHQMRGVPAEHARRRLVLFDCDDASPRPLTQKLLERPRLLERVRSEIDDPERAHLTVFNATPLERRLAVLLGIPLNACDPDLVSWGSKSGSRRIFRAAGLMLPEGTEDLADEHDLADAIAELWTAKPDLRRVVVKLNESFSGEGNAILDLRRLDPALSTAAQRRAAVAAALPQLQFEAAGLTWEAYVEQFRKMGGICEAWIEGEGKTSPSVQMRINPAAEVQAVSTHDQVLGGPNGQVFEASTFPARDDYRLAIQRQGVEVGKLLADKGVLGRFAVDFLAVPQRDGGPPRLYATEINLRQGGTTHPFNMLKFLTGGSYDEDTGRFLTAQGSERVYYSTDTLSAPRYRGIMPFDLVDTMVLHDIHFRADETGVVFHLLGCLSEFGKLGATFIAKTPSEAKALYDSTVALLDTMAAPQ